MSNATFPPIERALDDFYRNAPPNTNPDAHRVGTEQWHSFCVWVDQQPGGRARMHPDKPPGEYDGLAVEPTEDTSRLSVVGRDPAGEVVEWPEPDD